MDPSRERVQDDLRGLVAGEVRCDDLFVQLYASDASIHEIKPLGVVRPRSKEDVAACVEYAEANNIPVHARGAGTGLAGESLGPGLVLDFSRHMRRIIETTAENVRVQPGVVLERLNEHLRAAGRCFGPDPATASVTTVGGVVAVDAAGSHWLKHGSAHRHVEDLEIMLTSGRVMRVGREPLVDGRSHEPDLEKRDLVNRLVDLLARRRELIEKHQPRSPINRSGYHLNGVLSEHSLDLVKLLAGSEGTLALVLEAVLATQAPPRRSGVVILLFDRLESAARAVQEVLALGPTACDLMDRRHLILARESDVRYDLLVPPATEAILLVEHEGADRGEVQDRLRQTADRVVRNLELAFGSRQASDPQDVELYWRMARNVVATLYRLKGPTRPLPFVEDIVVPPADLPAFLVAMQNVLKRRQVTASLFAHAGHGQLHLRPFLDLTDPVQVRLMQTLAADLYDVVFDFGGSISGEHGDGLSRTSFLRRQYGELYDVFREVKTIFDPHNVFNPGKIVGDDPDQLIRHLRPSRVAEVASTASRMDEPRPAPRDAAPRETVPLELHWTPAETLEAASVCNGCGACRSQQAGVRMCPIFRFAPSEEASPRAKANLMRGLLTGRLEPETATRDDFKQIVDLCVHCHMCRLECPAEVDIPKLMLEARAGYVTANGLRWYDWVLSRIDSFSRIGASMSPVANWVIGNRAARWLLEKTLGVAQGRKLPRFTSRTFMRRAARRRLTRPTRRTGRKVLYLVDTYANYHDPQLGESLVAVLEHNGVAVYVPPAQLAAGMPLVALGAIEPARRVAARNVAMLAEAVRQGYHIVATEPSAALCLTHEYPQLLNDEDSRLVAQHSSEACSFLWQMHMQGNLQLDLKPINVSLGYHLPCHLKALGVGEPGLNLLQLIPGLTIQTIDKGCSGMAGTFGLKRQNYRSSLRAGWGLISAVRGDSWQVGATECSTCKIQMEQGGAKPTIHPLKLLALAYGLKPEVAELLTTRGQDLMVT